MSPPSGVKHLSAKGVLHKSTGFYTRFKGAEEVDVGSLCLSAGLRGDHSADELRKTNVQPDGQVFVL